MKMRAMPFHLMSAMIVAVDLDEDEACAETLRSFETLLGRPARAATPRLLPRLRKYIGGE